MSQLLALTLRLLLRLTPAGDVDVGHERSALRAPERLRRHLEPALAGGGAARVLDLERRAPGEHGAQGFQDPARVAIPRAGRVLADVQVAGADRDPDRVAPVLDGEPAPGVVHRDDAPPLVERRHVTVQRPEDGAPEEVGLEERPLGGPAAG